jgi:hypothetical protein
MNITPRASLRWHLGACGMAVMLATSGAASGGVRSVLRPDDRAGVRGVPNPPVYIDRAVRPDDRPGVRGIATWSHVLGASASLPVDSGFDWTAAGIGAAGALALCCIAATAAATRRRQAPA